MSRSFKKALKNSTAPPRPSRPSRKSRWRAMRIWWSRYHLVGAVLAIAVVSAGTWAGLGALDGRGPLDVLYTAMLDNEEQRGGNEVDLGGPPPLYETCAQMREVYPYGIKRSEFPKIYDANRNLDTNNDGVACERADSR